MNQKYVYHASKTSGIKVLKPEVSTHKKSWVYATNNIATAAMFLGDNFDFICQTGIGKDNKPFIFERFEGALEYAYRNKVGSIYKLSGETFLGNKTSWSAEVISEVPVKVLKEMKVNDSLTTLLDLEEKGALIIYRYPDTPPDAAKDKSDIISRAVDWTIDLGEKILDQTEQFHPDVLKKVIGILKKKGYKPITTKWKDKFDN